MDDYPWFTVVDKEEPLLQGDFISSCPIIVPPEKIEPGMKVDSVNEYDVIIMSQSCDLVTNKLEIVLVCSYWTLDRMEKESSFFKSRRGKNQLKNGNVPGYHLLNHCDIESHKNTFLVVDFRNVYGVPYKFLLTHSKNIGDRLRLLPPYREHLSQAFARFFMRVGLPIDIDPF